MVMRDLQLTDAINTLWEMHSRVGELFFVIIIVSVPPNKILILGSSFITGFQKLFATIPRIKFFHSLVITVTPVSLTVNEHGQK